MSPESDVPLIFLRFVMLFTNNLHLGIPGAKFLLLASLIIWIYDDVIVMSHDIIVSDIGFFGLNHFSH